MQVVSRVGPINRLFINNNPRFYGAYETTSTIAHIELMDHNNHPELARMLDGHKFHGNFLKCSAGKHVFHGLVFFTINSSLDLLTQLFKIFQNKIKMQKNLL